ncbi:nuclear transport factor 2 family protein [[Eubacterium] cellulosolvens]
MSRKLMGLGAIILILIVVSLIYSGSKTEIPNEITPTTPTPISSNTTSVPTSTSTNNMSDDEMIDQLIFEYHELVKSESLDQLVELFVDDAKLIVTQLNTYRFSGKNQIRNYYGSMFEAVEGPTELELVDTSISINGLKATVKCKVATDERFANETFELVKVGDVWKISSLNMSLMQ